MFDKLKNAEARYEEISLMLGQPDVINDQEKYKKLMKEYSHMEDLILAYREYKGVANNIKEAKLLLQDKLENDFKELVEEELKESQKKFEELENKLRVLLLPKDINDDKNVIIEIRAGAGGEEAALFVAVLFRMYSKYAEKNGWKTEIMDSNETEIGGFKEIVFLIEGEGAYSKLKFESGVHRVQRIPTTEANGRIHTSTVTVAVLPEVEDVDVTINPNDLRIDTYRASGAGGQHINKTDSAIRITHLPTGIVVSCQDERSQYKNKDKAMKVLRSKLYEIAQEEQDSMVAKERKNQVGTGDRSERIRTYNYPQGRVTDHRIGLTLYKLDEFFDGDIEEIVNALITTSQAKKLENGEGEF
ncbi:MAG: peptide chain release factor 1 [Clostridiales bacterium]|nr:peptide chain release factor 1 [Clostridiales bacterium]